MFFVIGTKADIVSSEKVLQLVICVINYLVFHRTITDWGNSNKSGYGFDSCLEQMLTNFNWKMTQPTIKNWPPNKEEKEKYRFCSSC